MKDDVISERSDEGGGGKELSRWVVKRVRRIQLTASVWKKKRLWTIMKIMWGSKYLHWKFRRKNKIDQLYHCHRQPRSKTEYLLKSNKDNDNDNYNEKNYTEWIHFERIVGEYNHIRITWKFELCLFKA